MARQEEGEKEKKKEGKKKKREGNHPYKTIRKHPDHRKKGRKRGVEKKKSISAPPYCTKWEKEGGGGKGKKRKKRKGEGVSPFPLVSA